MIKDNDKKNICLDNRDRFFSDFWIVYSNLYFQYVLSTKLSKDYKNVKKNDFEFEPQEKHVCKGFGLPWKQMLIVICNLENSYRWLHEYIFIASHITKLRIWPTGS